MALGAALDTKIPPVWRMNIALVYWIVGPFAALLGSAGSDIWLSIGAVFLLASSALSKQWQWLRQPWFIAATLFWLWLIFTALISDWPINALNDALPWIRFPVFAMVCLLTLQIDEKILEKLIWAMCIGLMIVAVIMLFERFETPNADKLFGPWKQNRKAGWYVVGMGLPVCLWFIVKANERTAPIWFALLILATLVGTSFNSGEIYMTLLLFLGLGTYILLSRLGLKFVIALALTSALLAAVVIVAFPAIAHAFIVNLQTNLPWYPSSGYHKPWMEGIGIALSNPIWGIGAKNFELYCEGADMLKITSEPQCNGHPHQLYIQTAAETGLIGLALFVGMALLLFRKALGSENLLRLPMKTALGLTILVTVFWPISSYSEAFGQHRNFFTWFSIGLALAISKVAQIRHESNPSS